MSQPVKARHKGAQNCKDEGSQGSATEGDDAWQRNCRPEQADPAQDAGFTLEDETIATTVETLMTSFVVSKQLKNGRPMVFVSPGWAAMTGFSEQKLLGTPSTTLQADGSKGATEELAQALKERRFGSGVLSCRRHDGRMFSDLVCVVPVADCAGPGSLLWLEVHCDLDERKRQGLLDDEHSALKWIEQVKHYLGAFMVVNAGHPGLPVVGITSGFHASVGYDPEEMLQAPAAALAGPATDQAALKQFITHMCQGKPGATKMLCYRRNGQPFWAYAMTWPLLKVIDRSSSRSPLQAASGAAGPIASSTPAAASSSGGGSQQLQLVAVLDITATRLKRVAKYVLGKVIGQGAFGTVRMGRNAQTDELVAVKMVNASNFRSISEIEQMQEEMSVLAGLRHPHIIRLHEVHFANNVFHMFMEFASGGSLLNYLQAQPQGRLPEPDAWRVFQQMLQAVDYCHRRRVIHRDLKPENILMDENNNIKIVDFGLAAVTSPFSGNLAMQCGTPDFLAPEITLGKEYDGAGVDIWSMGVILYEILTGVLPFTGNSQGALFKAIQRGVYQPLPNSYSRELRDLLAAMLTVDPAQRIVMDQLVLHPWNQRDPAARSSLTSLDGLRLPDEEAACTGSDGDQHSDDDRGLEQQSSDPCERGDSRPFLHQFHESVKIVVAGNIDDPIAAAIMRMTAPVKPGGNPADDSDASCTAEPTSCGTPGTPVGTSPLRCSVPNPRIALSVESPLGSGASTPASGSRSPANVTPTRRQAKYGSLPPLAAGLDSSRKGSSEAFRSPHRTKAGSLDAARPASLMQREDNARALRAGLPPLKDRTASPLKRHT